MSAFTMVSDTTTNACPPK